MNKPSIFILAGIGLLTFTLIIHNFTHINQGESQDLTLTTPQEKRNNESQELFTVEKNLQKHDANQNSYGRNHSSSEADFDFTPYISKEMADEIRPYTSRSMEGLEVKVDEEGHQYVDLKKRWSHATISVIDENGVKHTGEWAPPK